MDISGTAGHTHMVDLPSQAVTQVKDGHKVEKMSTTTDHAHLVTFNAEVPRIRPATEAVSLFRRARRPDAVRTSGSRSPRSPRPGCPAA